ncbi:hypothetical protein VTK56DRAFT_4854 [Thermocarpiscus australiensis]
MDPADSANLERPAAPSLQDGAEHGEWKTVGRVSGSRQRLTPFIGGTAAAPEDNSIRKEGGAYKENRAVTSGLSRESFSGRVCQTTDPKTLNGTNTRHSRHPLITSDPGWEHHTQGLRNLKIQDYDILWAYLTRFRFLHSVTMLLYYLRSGSVTYDKLLDSIAQEANKQQGVHCHDRECGRIHPSPPKAPYHEFCGIHHPGGMRACLLASAKQRAEYEEHRVATASQPPSPTTAKKTDSKANRSGRRLYSQVLAHGINN